MVVRSLKIVSLLLLVCFFAMPVQACFGPKLFLGLPGDLRGQVLTSIIAIYVKEKTGIDSKRVALADKAVLTEIKAENLDYGFSAKADKAEQVILQIDGLPMLASGPRILSDLQFTTVVPALQRLQRLLKAEHVELILNEVESGALPMAAARDFMMRERWI